MFQNGIADLILLMDRVLASKKEAVYQAPLYVTGRNLEEVTAILRLMDGYKKESCVIVQDFGLPGWLPDRIRIYALSGTDGESAGAEVLR